MRRFTLILLTLLASAVLGCRGDDGGSDAAPLDPAFARSIAEGAVLTLDDLPDGWVIAPPDEDDDDFDELDEFEEDFQECSGLDEDVIEEFTGQVADADSDEFERPGVSPTSVESSAAVFEDEDSAEDAMDQLRQVFSNCHQVFRDLFNEAFEQSARDDGIDPSQFDVDVRITEPDHDVGDNRYWMRIEGELAFAGTGLRVSFILDFIFFTRDRMGGSIFYFSLGEADDDVRDEVLATLDGKLRAGNESLDAGPPTE